MPNRNNNRQAKTRTGKAIHGDCLRVMRAMPEGSIDLIYLDPPYNSGREFGDFNDQWKWDEYLSFMRVRLVQCHRILKSKGTIYLHVDSNTSHYLKIIMDGIFGRANFRNEIIWSYRRWTKWSYGFQRMHDVILRFSKSENWTWNQLYEPLAEATVKRSGNRMRYRWWDKGKLHSKYLDKPSPGVAMRDVWEISYLNASSKERVGYPTQKPVALLDRVIKSSSNPGDVVLDPFCGSGTTLVAALKLDRSAIGIDANERAVEVAQERLSEWQKPAR